MSTLRVNNIQFNQEGNAAISVANSYNVVITIDGTEKIKLHSSGIDFAGGITINNVPVISGTGSLLSLPPVGNTGNVLTSNGTSWISQAPAPSGLTAEQVTALIELNTPTNLL